MARDAYLPERCLLTECIEKSFWHGIHVKQACQHVIKLGNAPGFAIFESVRMHRILCEFRGVFQDME